MRHGWGTKQWNQFIHMVCCDLSYFAVKIDSLKYYIETYDILLLIFLSLLFHINYEWKMKYICKLIFIPNISMIGSNFAILYVNAKLKVLPNRNEKKNWILKIPTRQTQRWPQLSQDKCIMPSKATTCRLFRGVLIIARNCQQALMSYS